jgi:hypothetical protein
MRKNTPESFWARVDRSGDGCWEWQGRLDGGYGRVMWHQKMYMAHRIAAWLSGMVAEPRGSKDISKSDLVLHKCDNRKCCNPAHLFVGSQADNIRDCFNKGRAVRFRGSTHANAVLTQSQVELVRDLYSNGDTQQSIADRFGVCRTTIARVVNRVRYK